MAKEKATPQHSNGFQVLIRQHTADFDEKLTDPERVQHILGAALDALGLQEEVDYTRPVTSHRRRNRESLQYIHRKDHIRTRSVN
jgi:hypothetical protein